MTRNSPRLAKRRLEPTYLSHPVYVETFGPEVVDLNVQAGFEPDPEQALFLDLLFAIGPDGKSVAFESDLIGPRQVMGKTGVLKMAELGWLYVTEQRLIVHSAHELDTTAEAFRDLKQLIQDTPFLSKHLDPDIGNDPGITEGNGRWSIQLVGDRRIKYKARTISGGRGLTGDKIVLDEGFALTRSHMGSLLPTLSVVPDPQVVIASSAGKRESAVLRDSRDQGRAGTNPRQVYMEYGDRDPSGCKVKDCDHHRTRPGCVLDDERRWRKFMPALVHGRATVETIRALRSSMPADEFARELMVHWDDPPNGDDGGVIDLNRWNALVNRSAPKPSRACVVLDVSPDRRKASIGVAGPGSRDGLTLVMTRTRGGWDWVVPDLVKLLDRQDVAEVALFPQSQAALLLSALADAGIDYTPLTTADAARSCAGFIEKVHADEPQLEHLGQAELDSAVGNAVTRIPGSSDSELWDRRDRTIDITALVSGSAAVDRWAMQDDYDVADSFL